MRLVTYVSVTDSRGEILPKSDDHVKRKIGRKDNIESFYRIFMRFLPLFGPSFSPRAPSGRWRRRQWAITPINSISDGGSVFPPEV